MNSLLKPSLPQIEKETHDAYMATFELNLMKMKNAEEVDLLFKKLKFLGLNFDPFNPEISEECKQVMESLGVSEHLKNPYLATNILLRLLDKTEERLNNLQQ